MDLSSYLLISGLLIAAILFLAWIFRRFVAHSLRRRAARRSLGVVDALPLSGRQRLVVVRCYDRHFLVGVGDKELTPIAELDAPEDESQGEGALALEPVAPNEEGPFEDLLAREVPTVNSERPRKPVLRDGKGILG